MSCISISSPYSQWQIRFFSSNHTEFPVQWEHAVLVNESLPDSSRVPVRGRIVASWTTHVSSCSSTPLICFLKSTADELFSAGSDWLTSVEISRVSSLVTKNVSYPAKPGMHLSLATWHYLTLTTCRQPTKCLMIQDCASWCGYDVLQCRISASFWDSSWIIVGQWTYSCPQRTDDSTFARFHDA